MTLLGKLFGDANEKTIQGLQPLAEQINEKELELLNISDEALREKSEALKKRAKEGEPLDALLPEAFALVRETARRVNGERHYDVQLLGGIALHQGKIVEMRTGEGKTLTATLPVYLNALAGKGVHVVTVNDYLAKRDTAWMGQVYAALGLTVGCVTHEGGLRYHEADPVHGEEADQERDEKGSFRVVESLLEAVSKQEAYACDITYGTNNEFGFDYLRDNMVLDASQMAQRGHAFAIVDEVDSILIDEARTPLIISAPDEEAPQQYQQFARIAPRLVKDMDYEVDEKRRAVLVTEEGVAKVEKMLGIGNLYDEGLRMVHFLEQSLRAHTLYLRDKDYIVRDGEVIIVDEFTGRVMPGRRWSEGLHQAVEAKEGVKMQAESRTLATITFQNYFRMYDKLSGMTGTAVTSAEEFHKVYELEVIVVPTDKPLVRKDHPDVVFRTLEGKWRALVADIKERHERGQPVLVGTTSIEKNELVSKLLEREGIPHEVLNAKQHAREGEIIAQAGRLGAVTVATNMAGRGVDIMPGGTPPNPAQADAVRAAGGLTVFGTERHEARRIDNQLRGRAGRQGDPGETQFFLSLEDDLMRIFGGDKIQALMARMNVPEDQPIESGMVSKALEGAQARIEGQNFDIRKHLLDYDDVVNKHRDAVYRRRRTLLTGEGHEKALRDLFRKEREVFVAMALASDIPSGWDREGMLEHLKTFLVVPGDASKELDAIVDGEGGVDMKRERVAEWLVAIYEQGITARRDALGDDAAWASLMKQALLRSIDTLWMEHLETMDALRDSVRLRAYGQRDPLVEYKGEASRLFKELEASIRIRTLQYLFRAHVHVYQHGEQTSRPADQQIRGAVRSDQSTSQLVRQSASAPGRNDPCPCGSGLKYKRCGLINAPEHKG